MKYVMLIADDMQNELLDPDALKAEYDKIYAWIAKWEARGRIADGGMELQPPGTARTVRRSGDGISITDGPYLELKEVIGGFMILEADTIAEAVEVAAEWPGIPHGAAVEVRPVVVR